MKKLILLLAGVLIGFAITAQTTSEVVTVDSSLTKTTLYSNALSFFAKEFKSANAVIQMKDPETGKVIGKGIANDKEIQITVSCKEGKYKYEIEYLLRTDQIDLHVNTYGTGYKNGKTTAKIVNGEIVMNSIYYDSNRGVMNSAPFSMLYDGTGKPMLTNNAYEKWKSEVDKAISEKAWSAITNSDKEILSKIIADLKTEMSTKNW